MTLLSMVALAVAWRSHAVVSYGWSLTFAEMVAAVVALCVVSPLLTPRWIDRVLVAPIGSTAAAAFAVLMAQLVISPSSLVLHVGLTWLIFSIVAIVTCRLGFRSSFSRVLRLMLGERAARMWLTGEPASIG